MHSSLEPNAVPQNEQTHYMYLTETTAVHLQHGDGAGNTSDKNSSIFSLT